MSGHDAWLHASGLREERELRCGRCGYRWWCWGHSEYGLWMPERDDDEACPECGELAE